MRRLLLVLMIVMLASATYGQKTKRMISITGGIAYPRGEHLQYWKTGFNIGASYNFSMSTLLWLGAEIDLNHFEFDRSSYLNYWNECWNNSDAKSNVAGKGRTFFSISGSSTMMLVEKEK